MWSTKFLVDHRDILGWSQSVSAILPYNPLIRSARLYGQFYFDKTVDVMSGLQCTFKDSTQFNDFFQFLKIALFVKRVVLQYLLLAVLVCPTIVMTCSYGRIIVEVRHVVKQRQRCATLWNREQNSCISCYDPSGAHFK